MASPATTPLAAHLARLSGRERYDALISRPDAAMAVPEMDARDLFLLIKENGVRQSAELLALCSGEQLRAFADLDAWSGDTFEAPRFGDYLLALLESGVGTALRILGDLDTEIWPLCFQQTVTVRRTDEVQDQAPEPGTTWVTTPDGHYVLQIPDSHFEFARALARILDALYAENPNEAWRLLESAREETPTMLQEDAYRWRTGRMRDLGIPSREDAVTLFAALDEDALDALAPVAWEGIEPRPPQALAARELAAGTLARAAWENVRDGREFNAMMTAWSNVAHALMVARGYDLGDLDSVRAALEEVREVTGLALTAAARRLGTDTNSLFIRWHPRWLFQHGHTLRMRLRARLQAKLRAWGTGMPADFAILPSPWREFCEGATRAVPVWTTLAGAPPREGFRHFGHIDDLDTADDLLMGTICAVEIVPLIAGFAAAPLAPEVWYHFAPPNGGLATVDVLVQTTLVLAMDQTGTTPQPPRPVQLERLHAFVERAFEQSPGGGGRLRPEVRGSLTSWWRKRTRQIAPGQEAAAMAWLHRALRQLEDELGGMGDTHDLVPATIGCVAVATPARPT